MAHKETAGGASRAWWSASRDAVSLPVRAIARRGGDTWLCCTIVVGRGRLDYCQVRCLRFVGLLDGSDPSEQCPLRGDRLHLALLSVDREIEVEFPLGVPHLLVDQNGECLRLAAILWQQDWFKHNRHVGKVMALDTATLLVIEGMTATAYGGYGSAAGKTTPSEGATIVRKADAPPLSWQVVRVDLWALVKNPWRIRSLMFNVQGGGAALDQIVLGRTESNLPRH